MTKTTLRAMVLLVIGAVVAYADASTGLDYEDLGTTRIQAAREAARIVVRTRGLGASVGDAGATMEQDLAILIDLVGAGRTVRGLTRGLFVGSDGSDPFAGTVRGSWSSGDWNGDGCVSVKLEMRVKSRRGKSYVLEMEGTLTRDGWTAMTGTLTSATP